MRRPRRPDAPDRSRPTGRGPGGRPSGSDPRDARPPRRRRLGRLAVAGAFAGLLAGLLTALTPASASREAPAQGAPRPAHAARPALTIAHRGASAYAPENTVAAVDEAARRGFTWVENDVQRTRDGVLVVLHDGTLDRTTDARRVFPGRAPWRLSDFTLAEVRRLDAGRWFGRRFTGERIPTLRSYLAAVSRNRQDLLLELKDPRRYPGVERQTLEELRTDGWLDGPHVAGRLVVQSFDAGALRTVHRLRPEVRTGLLGAPPVRDLPRYAAFCDLVNPAHTALTGGYLKAVHALRGPHGAALRAFVWTVDDRAGAVRVARRGADGVITNAPEVVRAALGHR